MLILIMNTKGVISNGGVTAWSSPMARASSSPFLIERIYGNMAGTKAGAKKAAITNKLKHGSDFYARIGRKGGQNGNTGGFAANPELARVAGAKGGRISRRGPAKKSIKVVDQSIDSVVIVNAA